MAKKDADLMESGAKVKLGTSDKIIRGFGYIFITFYAICCIVPFLIIIGTSFTSETVIRSEGVKLIPKDLTVQAYQMVLKGGGIYKAYVLTIILTLVGTLVGLGIIDRLCLTEKGLCFPECDFLLYLLHQPVFRRTCSLLPADDPDLQIKGQLLCSAASFDDVSLADHPDEELCKSHTP